MLDLSYVPSSMKSSRITNNFTEPSCGVEPLYELPPGHSPSCSTSNFHNLLCFQSRALLTFHQLLLKGYLFLRYTSRIFRLVAISICLYSQQIYFIISCFVQGRNRTLKVRRDGTILCKPASVNIYTITSLLSADSSKYVA